MNNEFEEVTAVPRPRPSFEHQQGSEQEQAGKKASSNGHYTRNGHSDPRSKRQSRAEERWNERRRERREARSWKENDREPRRALPYYGPELPEDDGFKLPFDPLRFVAALRRNWSWLAVITCVLAMAGLIAGAFLVKYNVSVHLIRRQSLNAFSGGQVDPLAPREYSDQMLYSFMKSGEVLKRVAAAAATNAATAGLGLKPGDLGKRIAIKPSPVPDLVTLSVSGLGNIGGMVELANMYASEVVRYTKEIQQMEAAEIHRYLEKKLTEQDKKISQASKDLRNFSSGVLDFDREVERDLKRLDDLQTRAEKSRIELEIVGAQLNAGDGDSGTVAPTSPIAQAEAELQRLQLEGLGRNHPSVQRQRDLIEKMKQAEAKGELKMMAPSSAIANNPMVQRGIELKARKAAAEKELSQLTNLIEQVTVKLRKSAEADQGISYAMAKNQLAALNATRTALQQKFEQTQAYVENAMGYFRIYAPATAGSVNFTKRWIKVGLLGVMGAIMGLALAAFGVMLVEAMDTKLKTREDVERVTGLPVLATLGDLRKMSPSGQVNWAFRTLTLLKGKLSMDPNQALVCGIVSSGHGEGRSTWVNLLVSAASQRGLRVLTVDTRPTSVGPSASVHKEKKKEEEKAAAAAAPAPKPEGEELPVPQAPDTTLTTNVLSTPATVAEQLTDPNSQPVVHIPLPGWVWNLERRKQWKDALEHWRKIDNLVIFVELPPASQPEAVLLSEHLPQLLWLVGSGMADAAETTEQLNTLRHARCNLVGALLNQAPPPVFNARIARWFTRVTSIIAISASVLSANAQKGGQAEAHRRAVEQARAKIAPQIQVVQQGEAVRPQAREERITPLDQSREAGKDGGLSAVVPQVEEVRVTEIEKPEVPEGSGAAAAQEAGAGAQNAELTFSGGARKRKAKWQEKLTLGPGDVFDIHFYGNSALSRTNIFVGPDGAISYLQVQGLKVEGLTIEEVRARLDEELARNEIYTSPRTIVIPVSFTSKRYYMLGKVQGKGTYVMDRPITVVEAVARAKGLETGLYQRNSVEMADLSRSFIVRDGEKLEVNLEKLFLEGDLSQNLVLEPNDYLYFESAAVNDIYVLGEVMNPGPLGFVPNASVITAITDRGGYTDRAYKRKVLVVRGSLNQPETFVVDTGAILDARNADFRLQARDIVYVSRRPWNKIEELLDEAAQSFIQGAVTGWAGVNAGPIIKQKILPSIRK